jgi:hypothetical protein
MKQFYDISAIITPIEDGERQEEERYCTQSHEQMDMEATSLQEVFGNLREEFGRCTGKVYIDKKDETTRSIGWIFEKRERYEDNDKPFILETWVTILEPCGHCGNLMPKETPVSDFAN